MTAKEKAKAGLRLLEEAAVEYFGEHPDGVPSRQFREQLQLLSPDSKGQREDYLAWGLENRLIVAGRVRKDREAEPQLLILAKPV